MLGVAGLGEPRLLRVVLECEEVPHVRGGLEPDIELDEVEEVALELAEVVGIDVVKAVHKVHVPHALVLPDLAGEDQRAQAHAPPCVWQHCHVLPHHHALHVRERHDADLGPQPLRVEDRLQKVVHLLHGRHLCLAFVVSLLCCIIPPKKCETAVVVHLCARDAANHQWEAVLVKEIVIRVQLCHSPLDVVPNRKRNADEMKEKAAVREPQSFLDKERDKESQTNGRGLR